MPDKDDIPEYEDIAQLYMKEVNAIPQLTHKETMELIKKAQQGDKNAEQKVIKHNLALVVTIAHTYDGKGPFLDIIQNGNIGLIRSIKTFDTEKGYKFGTYAVPWIKHYIQRGIMSEEQIVALPADIWHYNRKIKALDEKAVNSEQKVLSDKNMAKTLGTTEEKTAFIRAFVKTPTSLDKMINEDETVTLGETLSDEKYDIQTLCEQEFLKDELYVAMNNILKDAEKQVIELKFGLKDGKPKKGREMAEILGVSRQRIDIIEKTALRKLRTGSYSKRLKEFL